MGVTRRVSLCDGGILVSSIGVSLLKEFAFFEISSSEGSEVQRRGSATSNFDLNVGMLFLA
jgi:hypothetical protein